MSLPDTLSPTTLRQKNGSVRLLDVRTPGEFAASRIPGSHNIPLGDLESYADALAKADTELVVVCQSGGRAKLAADALRAKGRSNVSVLDGGLGAWESAGGDTEGGASAWTIERQVRLVAGSLVLTGILASLKYPKAKFLSGAIGGGLTFAALSNTCMMGSLLAKLPFNRAASADIESAIVALNT
ncbi:rhodanese-like domain-containing protein [Sporichthya polymorpha]|uniref:rhodanese-like domain-containing protein n=1 Tax=Sporichthya polymorpha TaxID=35751 RepID=UPI000366EC55|nr:rhodanese-like domain-containing protein [Sporichthya polymorpha]